MPKTLATTHKTFRQKKQQRIKPLTIKNGVLPVAQITIDSFYAESMKEIARRLKLIRKMHIEDFYVEALREYIQDKQIPRRILKRIRKRVQIQMPEDGFDLLNACAKLAFKDERPTSAVIEEALKRYLEKPEHYLGKAFEERHPRRYEIIK